MNRRFMCEYYDRMYDSPVSAATASDPDYASAREEHLRMEETFAGMLGGRDSEGWKFYEEMMLKLHEMYTLSDRDLYLMGAEDREKMLR